MVTKTPLPSGSPPPYRSSLAGALGCVLGAAAINGTIDCVHAGGGAPAALAIFGLWALVALPLALVVGLVFGAGGATWGVGFVPAVLRKLRDDKALDHAVTGALIAAACAAGVLAVAVAKLVGPLVIAVQRQNVGALLLGIVAAVLAIVLVAFALPVFRVARLVARAVPPIGPMPRVVVLLAAAAGAAVGLALLVIYRGLDAAALHLGFLFMLAMLPVLALVLAIVAYGPAAGLRAKLPARGILAIVAAVIAIVVPYVGLTGNPSDATKAAVIDRSYIGSKMIEMMRAHIDHDGDGYSPFFGGPDCDDDNPNVNPGMPEIPGNGIDDNCMGGDAPLPVDPGSGSSGSGSSGAATAAPVGPSLHADNVVIIFVDTLRYDHLGFTGYRRDDVSISPRIDQFAAKATTFRCAFSQAPNTPRSVPSFMSSKYPSQIHFDKQFKSYAEVLDDNDLMFEQLKAAGLGTYGESSHFYFCDDKKRPNDCAYAHPKHSNVDQGVDVWDNSEAVDIAPSNHDIAGPRITTKVVAKLDELAQSKQRFAMMVHLFDPHSTYMEHPGFNYKHGKDSLMEKYDYEVAFDDKLIGYILDELDKTKLADDTAVIVMADHGEAFGEHVVYGQADYFHGDTLYAELIHVPLIVRVPGVAAGCTRNDVVQLVDLAPTVAAIAGAEPAKSWVGRSLVPALACDHASTLPAKPAFAELLPEPMWDHDAKAMVTADCGREAYFRISDGRWEIYDLDHDPAEKTDISGEPGADALKSQLTGWIEGGLAAGRNPGAGK